MITVRNAVFETNSSSTHAISFITNYDLDKLPHYVSFHLVPKCEMHPGYAFCTESKKRSCGRHPLISEVFKKDETT